MNQASQIEAENYIADCVAVLSREVDAVELLRFTYYYAMKRREREDVATEWLETNRPDVVKRLSPTPGDGPSPAGPTQPTDEDVVKSAIKLANQATVLQARARGRAARSIARSRPESSNRDASRESSLWGMVLAEQRQKELTRLRTEIDTLKAEAEKEMMRLTMELGKLGAENERLEAELARRIAELAAGRAGTQEKPILSVEERMNALKWLARNKPVKDMDKKARDREERVDLFQEFDLQEEFLLGCAPAEED